MRWVFIAILVLNTSYLLWNYFHASDAGVAGQVHQRFEATAFPSDIKMLESGGAGAGTGGGGIEIAIAKPVSGCPWIGPFFSEAKAGELIKRLNEVGIAASESHNETEDMPIYWVYLPAKETRQQSLRVLRELQAAGIDSFVVVEGGEANAISLGSFTLRDSALGLQARLRASGYQAQVREQVKPARAVWVVLEDDRAQGYAEFISDDMRGGVGVRIERKSCLHER
jgi:hypothetical protein